MTVIPFRPKHHGIDAQPASSAFQSASGPQPDFDDSHSHDFPEEPRYNKRQCGFLTWDEESRLIRLAIEHDLKIEADENTQTIYLSMRYNPKTEKTTKTVHVLHPSRNPHIPVAEIRVKNSAFAIRMCEYTLANEEKIIKSASFLGLMRVFEHHLQTGSPELPEPEFWR